MNHNGGNHLPAPTAIWIALAVIAFAVAVALGSRRRIRFIEAIEKLVAEHEARTRVVGFGRPQARSAAMTRAIRPAAAWLHRLAAELRRTLP